MNNLIKEFEDYIIAKQLLPGDKVPGEIELAEYFKVSRSNIRETLKYFTQLGILERVKKKGTVVKMPSVEDIGHSLAFQLKMLSCSLEELKTARLLLETSLADEIIQNIRPENLKELEEKNNELEGLRKQPLAADQADEEFHMLFLNCSGNRLCRVFSEVITLIFDEKFRERHHSEKTIEKSVRSHRAMIKAIKEKDADTLVEILREHILPL